MIDSTAQIHSSSFIDEGAIIGAGTVIWHFCHIMPGAVIGPDCRLGQNVVVMSGVQVGRNVKIQNNVSLYEGVELADDVFCGPSCVFTNVSTPRSHVSRKHAYETTRVGRGASIGANATIVCGVTIGEYALIGAGAVVTRDVPPHALVVGVPAQIKGWVCSCGEILPAPAGRGASATWTCTHCDARYHVTGCQSATCNHGMTAIGVGGVGACACATETQRLNRLAAAAPPA